MVETILFVRKWVVVVKALVEEYTVPVWHIVDEYMYPNLKEFGNWLRQHCKDLLDEKYFKSPVREGVCKRSSAVFVRANDSTSFYIHRVFDDLSGEVHFDNGLYSNGNVTVSKDFCCLLSELK